MRKVEGRGKKDEEWKEIYGEEVERDGRRERGWGIKDFLQRCMMGGR